MKRFIAFVVALSMMLALVSVPVSAETASAGTRSVDPSEMYADFTAHVPESVTAGEEFPVVVEIEGEYEAHILKLLLQFDSEMVEYVSCAYGEITTQAQASNGFPMVALQPNGNILSYGIMMPFDPFTGSGEIYTATFRAKQDLSFNEYGFVLFIEVDSDFAYFPNGSTPTPIASHSESVLVDNDSADDPSSNAEIFVESPEKVYAGDDIEVTVNISGEYQMSGIQFTMYYDAGAFEINEFAPGAVLDAASDAGGFYFSEYEATPGEVSIIVVIADALITDEGVIYTLNMHVADDAEPGMYDFDIELASFIYSEPGTTDVYDITDVTVTPSETEIVATYTVTWVNWDGEELEVDENVEAGTMPTYDGEEPTKPEDDQYTYTFSGWDPEVSEVTGDITYTAVFEQTVKTYTVTWLNWDETELEVDEDVEYGTMPTYDGDEPTKEGDDQYTYTFIGWDPEVSEVTGDITYTAVFEQTVKTYTVTWLNWDETELEVDEDVEHGTMPTYDGEEPTKPEDDQYTYTFIGWDPEVSEVTGDITYIAVFEAVEKPAAPVVFTVNADPDQVEPGDEFEVTLEISGVYAANGLQIYIEYDADNFEAIGVENGEVLNAVTNALGLVVTDYETFPGSIRIVFIVDQAVDVEGTIVTVTMRAKDEAEVGEYDLTPNVVMFFSSETTEQNDIEYETVPGTVEILEKIEFTVTYIVDGEEIEVQTYAEGDTIEPIECPEDLIPEGHHFVEWEGMPEDLVMPGENIEVTAVFEPNEYVVTYMAGNNLVAEKTVPFGGTVESIECPDEFIPEGYHFVGWETIPETMPAQNITVYAVFEINTYTVTWVNEDGTELEVDEEVPYGEMPTYDGDEPTKEGDDQYSYTFIGWDPEVSEVTGDITYTAVFEQTVNTYTVIFIYGYDLSLTETVEVPYGSAATAPELPEYFWWDFIGWDTDFSNVTEDITVTAQYVERGDAEQDGDVDMADALLVLRYVMGLEPDADTTAMDIDRDGEITMVDALLLQRHVMGLLSPNLAW